jgi:hypothetical protein
MADLSLEDVRLNAAPPTAVQAAKRREADEAQLVLW